MGLFFRVGVYFLESFAVIGMSYNVIVESEGDECSGEVCIVIYARYKVRVVGVLILAVVL